MLIPLWLAISWAAPAIALAQQNGAAKDSDDTPLIDRDPFDRIHLDARNSNALMDVQPLGMTGPIDYDQRGTLKFTLLEIPDKVYQVPWSNVVQIERYEEMILDEARTALENRDFSTAFRDLIFLAKHAGGAGSVELRQAIDRCLYQDARQSLEKEDFESALSALEQLYERNPGYQVDSADVSVVDMIGKCFDQLIQRRVDSRQFAEARQTLAIMESRYGRLNAVRDKWRTKIEDEARELLGEVQQTVAAGEAHQGHQAVRELMFVMPELEEADNMFADIVQRFPYVYVGVTEPEVQADLSRMDNWSARRVGRLTQRKLFEFRRPGDEGGDYVFPNGRLVRTDDLGLEYRLEIRNPEGGAGVPPTTTYQISNRLLDLADPRSPEYYVPWARVIRTIEIDNDRSVSFQLRAPYVRPEALLQVPYRYVADRSSESPNGLYARVDEVDNRRAYELNPAYPAKENDGQQHPRLVEVVYPSISSATDALVRGQVDIVDRVFPSDIRMLKQNPDIEVQPYMIPTVHMLIPNPRNLFMGSDNFRRALLYGINRELILNQMIAGGQDLDGYELISGPFPPGTDLSDQIAYAYNQQIRPRPHSGKLGIVLAKQVELAEVDRLKKQREEEALAISGDPQTGEAEQVEIKVERPTLVLAFPDNEMIRTICETIQQHWKLIGVDSTLRPLPPGVTIPDDDDYDLLYVELQMQEPLVDAYRLFGKGGLVKIVDPTIEQALRQLDSATSWGEVSASLKRMHQQCFNNVTILPLWQIADHYAFRKNLFNIGQDVVYLYQNVDRWRLAPPASSVTSR